MHYSHSNGEEDLIQCSPWNVVKAWLDILALNMVLLRIFTCPCHFCLFIHTFAPFWYSCCLLPGNSGCIVQVLQYTQNWITVHCKAITDGRLYFFLNHTTPLFSNCLFLIKCCSSEYWKLSRSVLNRKRLIRNTMKCGKNLKGVFMFNPESSKIPLGCAIVFWGIAVLICFHTSQLNCYIRLLVSISTT